MSKTPILVESFTTGRYYLTNKYTKVGPESYQTTNKVEVTEKIQHIILQALFRYTDKCCIVCGAEAAYTKTITQTQSKQTLTIYLCDKCEFMKEGKKE